MQPMSFHFDYNGSAMQMNHSTQAYGVTSSPGLHPFGVQTIKFDWKVKIGS